MLRRSFVLVALLALVAFAAPAGASSPAFSASGSYLLGDGVSAEVVDACFTSYHMGRMSPQDGLDSNCIDLPAGLGGLAFHVTSADLTGTANVVPCFYDASGIYLGCPSGGDVPAGAAMASFSSLTGYAVTWTFTVG